MSPISSYLGAGGIEAVSNLSDATAPARFLNLGATRMNVTETVAGTYSGVIRNGSSGNVGGILSVSGTAPLTLTGVNTYTGKTSVSGVLRLGAGSSIAASKDVKMIAGGVFDISGDDQLNGVIIAKLKGPAGTVQLGGRTLVLNTATAGEFDGTIVDGGASPAPVRDLFFLLGKTRLHSRSDEPVSALHQEMQRLACVAFRTLTPTDAAAVLASEQREIADDWPAAYRRYIGS